MRNLQFASAGLGVLTRIEVAQRHVFWFVLEVPGYSSVTVLLPLILKQTFSLFSTASPGNA